MKKFIYIILFFSLTNNTPIFANEISDLSKYDTLNKVSKITEDREIQTRLRSLLKEDYNTFISNFDVYGDPHKLIDDGLFVEGWLKDLYLYNASAFVIYPDGRLYTAWVSPRNETIQYRTNVANSDIIQSDIKNWSSRFKDVDFVKKNRKQAPTLEHTVYFETDKYLIKISPNCNDNIYSCNNFTYEGKRKSDGSTLKLSGISIRENCNNNNCEILSYRFENKGTNYLLSKIDKSLIITSNNKIILHTKGIWSQQ